MKAILVVLMLLVVSCGKKDEGSENRPAAEDKRAPVAEPGFSDMIGDKTRTGEEIPGKMEPTTADPQAEMAAEDPATGDATPVAPPRPTAIGGDVPKPGPVLKDTVKPSTGKVTGGVSSMSSVDLDEDAGEGPSDVRTLTAPKDRKKRAPKPDPQASGYGGMDQDEPTQE